MAEVRTAKRMQLLDGREACVRVGNIFELFRFDWHCQAIWS